MLSRKPTANSGESDTGTDSVTDPYRQGRMGPTSDNSRNAERGRHTGKLQKHVSAKLWSAPSQRRNKLTCIENMLSHFKYGILLNSFRGSIRFKRPNYVMMTSRLMRGQLESNLTNIFLFGRLFRRKSYHIFTSYSSNWFFYNLTLVALESHGNVLFFKFFICHEIKILSSLKGFFWRFKGYFLKILIAL